jgi:hypothetical protein
MMRAPTVFDTMAGRTCAFCVHSRRQDSSTGQMQRCSPGTTRATHCAHPHTVANTPVELARSEEGACGPEAALLQYASRQNLRAVGALHTRPAPEWHQPAPQNDAPPIGQLLHMPAPRHSRPLLALLAQTAPMGLDRKRAAAGDLDD